jgi:flagellin-like protein
MQLKHICGDADERAVSPVVGVAILVGITVILASIVGAFVFGLVNLGQSPPDAQFTFNQGSQNFSTSPATATRDENVTTVQVTHNSGEAVSYQELSLRVSGNQTEPTDNESVYEIDYQGDDAVDRWEKVLDNRSAVLEPGQTVEAGFYGISESFLTDGSSAPSEIVDYNTGDDANPDELIGLDEDGTVDSPTEFGYKMGSCDEVKVVWTAESGASGQILQTYQLPGRRCA